MTSFTDNLCSSASMRIARWRPSRSRLVAALEWERMRREDTRALTLTHCFLCCGIIALTRALQQAGTTGHEQQDGSQAWLCSRDPRCSWQPIVLLGYLSCIVQLSSGSTSLQQHFHVLITDSHCRLDHEQNAEGWVSMHAFWHLPTAVPPPQHRFPHRQGSLSSSG